MKIHPVFHVSLFKRHIPNNNDLFPERITPPPDPVIIDDKEKFEVEDILDHRINKRKPTKTEYLIKWKGYPEYDATWESEDNLQNAQEMLKQYIRSNEDVRA